MAIVIDTVDPEASRRSGARSSPKAKRATGDPGDEEQHPDAFGDIRVCGAQHVQVLRAQDERPVVLSADQLEPLERASAI